MRGSDSKTRSMNSTWKIALDSACAGPSWTSWASRARSASCASTIRIWSSVEHRRQRGLRHQRRVAALQEQPRALEVADRELQARELRLVAAQLAAGPRHPPRIIRSRRSAAPASAALRPRPRRRRRSGRRPVAPSLEGAQLVRERLPAGQVVQVGRAIPVADGAQRVGGVRERLRGFRVQLVEPGARRFAPGIDPSCRV